MSLHCLVLAAASGLLVCGWLRYRGDGRHLVSAMHAVRAAALAAIVTLGVTWRLSPDTWQQYVFAAATTGLLLVSAFDIATKRLPDVFTLPALMISVAAVLISGHGIGPALVSGAVALVLFGLLWLAGRGRGIGLGDVKLAPTVAVLAGWVSWTVAVGTLYISVLSAALYAVWIIASPERRTHSRDFAYGPFLTAGLLVAVLFWG